MADPVASSTGIKSKYSDKDDDDDDDFGVPYTPSANTAGTLDTAEDTGARTCGRGDVEIA